MIRLSHDPQLEPELTGVDLNDEMALEDHDVMVEADEQASIEAAARAADFDAMEREAEAAADLNEFQAGGLL